MRKTGYPTTLPRTTHVQTASNNIWHVLAQHQTDISNPPHNDTPPSSLWIMLEQTVNNSHTSHPASAGPQSDTTQTTSGIWRTLTHLTDPAAYQPRRIAHVAEEAITEGEQTFTVLRSPQGTYLRLKPAEYELWQAMDGSRTVAQLATFGFMRFKQLLPVASLVQSLKQQGFLVDTPTHIYHELQTRLEYHTPEGWGQRLLRTLRSYTISIKHIDGIAGYLYQGFGRFCFTLPFVLLLIVISVAGLFAFVLAPGHLSTIHTLVDADGIPTSLLALWIALLISFVLHELAHALAVKHHGRTVWRGGIMLYYGMPAAFVDTSDIWLAGRRARILVSMAGPLSDLLVGGIASLYAYLFPTAFLATAAYKLAFACYGATLFNLNPLLELDGYYILSDSLRMPNLRRRSLDFVRGPLWARVWSRVSMHREERILTFYGLLTLLYTICAIMLVALFWQRQFMGMIIRLWSGGWPGQIMAVLLIGMIGLPLIIGLLLGIWGLIHAGAVWLERRGYAHHAGIFTAILMLLVGLLTLLPLRLSFTVEELPLTIRLIAPLLWLVALTCLLSVRPDYRGAGGRHILDALLIAGLLALLATAGRLLLPMLQLEQRLLTLAIHDGIFLLLMLAGFAALVDVDLHRATARELGMTAFMLPVAFAMGSIALRQAEITLPGASLIVLLAAAMPVYCGILALTLFQPHIMGLRDSRLIWGWLPLWMGFVVQTTAYFMTLQTGNQILILMLDILTAGLWAVAWCMHYVTLRTLSPPQLQRDMLPAASEAERLQRGFQACYAGCYTLLRAVYGSRRANALDDRMDNLAATANWDVTLDRAEARIGTDLSRQSLEIQGTRYAEVMRYTIQIIEEITGARFAQRAIQSAYDTLPWPEREALERRSFPHTPWAQVLSHSFGDMRTARLRLLRQVDLFIACEDTELAAIAATLQEQRFHADTNILAHGITPEGIWIIEAGEIAIWKEQHVVAEMHRGDSFGAVETIETSDGIITIITNQPTPATASFRTTVESTLLYLPLRALPALNETRTVHLAESLQTMHVLRLFERIPLFAEVPRQTLRTLARQAHHETVSPRTIIVRQGQTSRTFYVIKQGQAAVIASVDPEQTNLAETPRHRAQVIAHLGPEEFFGEMQLLFDRVPEASVVATTSMELLALPHTLLADLMIRNASVARQIEQISTGRRILGRDHTDWNNT